MPRPKKQAAQPKQMAEVMISVGDDFLDRIDEVVEGLRDAGLRVGAVMESIGTITGSVNAARMDALSHVEGVSGVSRAREYRLAPADSDTQ